MKSMTWRCDVFRRVPKLEHLEDNQVLAGVSNVRRKAKLSGWQKISSEEFPVFRDETIGCGSFRGARSRCFWAAVRAGALEHSARR